ncbi:MAG: methylmalonyl Co-A mutase-associated GTPase MeaB [Acidobacteria bacterium]|nr:methylmalonyl Co-A mutase-associated GTPase MeaB [Acidobacteriota bacterium]
MELNLWVEKIRGGDVRLLARGLSEIENRGPRSRALLSALFPHSGQARVIGLTGAPGAGKSTVVSALALEFRKREKRVAILAVDPTSPFTGGSILGDRIRMQAHDADGGVYIRSMATRGSLGGLAPTAADVLVALDAAGFDVILIETVGVGQAEVDVVRIAGAVALLLTPSSGDDVQTMKAGIMEVADVFVINKADLPGADRLESELRAMLSIQPVGAGLPILRTVATAGQGIDKLAEALLDIDSAHAGSADYWRHRLTEMVSEKLMDRLVRGSLSEEHLAVAARQVAVREANPYELVDELVRGLLTGRPLEPECE